MSRAAQRTVSTAIGLVNGNRRFSIPYRIDILNHLTKKSSQVMNFGPVVGKLFETYGDCDKENYNNKV